MECSQGKGKIRPPCKGCELLSRSSVLLVEFRLWMTAFFRSAHLEYSNLRVRLPRQQFCQAFQHMMPRMPRTPSAIFQSWGQAQPALDWASGSLGGDAR